jgi:uncharacterized protein (DUF1330 family)
MTVDEMKNEIRTYCLNLILNSKAQDWDTNNRYIKDNIIIKFDSSDKYRNYFDVHIYREYKDGNFRTQVTSIEFKKNVKFWFNSKERKETKLLKKKYFEIKNYFKNKQEYDRALEAYKLLPLTQLRKNKLNVLNKKNV